MNATRARKAWARILCAGGACIAAASFLPAATAGDVPFDTHTIATGVHGAYCVCPADVDGDGDMDVVAAARLDHTITIYLNDGAQPPAFAPLLVDGAAMGAWCVQAADMDNDGDMDIAAACYHDDMVVWYENHGAGLSEGVFLLEALTSDTASWDGLGAVANESPAVEGSGGSWIISGADVFGTPVATMKLSSGAPGAQHSAADFCFRSVVWDGGSILHSDLTEGASTESSPLGDWVVSCAPGTFLAKLVHGIAAVGISGGAVDEIDGDEYVLFEFDPAVTVTELTLAHLFIDGQCGDIGNEIAKVTVNEGLVASRSTLSFTKHIIDNAADGALCVCIVDVDGDGRRDVVGASHLDDKVAWHRNMGGVPPVFSPRPIALPMCDPLFVRSADLDADGDVDLVAALCGEDAVVWFDNVGGGTPAFVKRPIDDALDGASSLHPADVDGDGDIDVLSVYDGHKRVAWHENVGGSPPGFVRHPLTTNAHGAYTVDAADLDGDDVPDIVYTCLHDETLAWCECDGESPPSFTQRVVVGDPDAWSARPADMDGDGDVDLVTASPCGASIVWYQNLTIDARCPADMNRDGATMLDDFQILSAAFGSTDHVLRREGDLTGDGAVTLDDFSVLAADFGCFD